MKRIDGEVWFAEEKFGQELYHAKVGDHTIVTAIGNFATTPVKNAEKRREHIRKVVADNVQRFFLSKHSVKTICDAFHPLPSKMNTRECANWIESQKGRGPREVIREARRRFAGASEELLFGQFETAVGRQVQLAPQEWEAFRRLADGMLHKQIAGDMKLVAKNNHLRSRKGGKNSSPPMATPNAAGEPDPSLSDETVRKYVSAVRRKAGGNVNRLEAVLWFLGFEL